MTTVVGPIRYTKSEQNARKRLKDANDAILSKRHNLKLKAEKEVRYFDTLLSVENSLEFQEGKAKAVRKCMAAKTYKTSDYNHNLAVIKFIKDTASDRMLEAQKYAWNHAVRTVDTSTQEGDNPALMLTSIQEGD